MGMCRALKDKKSTKNATNKIKANEWMDIYSYYFSFHLPKTGEEIRFRFIAPCL